MWRLFQFWLPVPAGGLCYLGLKLTGHLDPHRIAVDDPAPG